MSLLYQYYTQKNCNNSNFIYTLGRHFIYGELAIAHSVNIIEIIYLTNIIKSSTIGKRNVSQAQVNSNLTSQSSGASIIYLNDFINSNQIKHKTNFSIFHR